MPEAKSTEKALTVRKRAAEDRADVSCSWSNFAKVKDDPSSLVHAAVTQGREIYRAREQCRGRPKV
ncbi:MAG: hypothetical protein QOJ15_6601 [Bradyrhizobium sp.]|jgi:hypothetical protein|nr:hypothetical protein [Bradyrhizobium sp.]